jgi:hypothetical protein
LHELRPERGPRVPRHPKFRDQVLPCTTGGSTDSLRPFKWHGAGKGNCDRVTSDSSYFAEGRSVRVFGASVLLGDSAYRRLATYFDHSPGKTASSYKAIRPGSGKPNGGKRFRRGQLEGVQRRTRESGPALMHVQEQGA